MIRRLLLIGATIAGCAFAVASSAQQWSASCYDGTYTCVSIGGSPTELTPAQKAEQERLKREGEAKAAARKARVDALVSQWGEHRRGEAERFIDMQQAADAARPKPVTPPQQPKQCTERITREAVIVSAKDSQVAIAKLGPAASKICQGRTGSPGNTLEPPRCEKLVKPGAMFKAPVGDCFQCASPKLAMTMGWKPGVGWPPDEISWQCKAAAICATPIKDCGGSKVSPQ